MKNDVESLKTKIFILSKTYSLLNSYFVHWQDSLELDLDKLYRENIPRILQTENDYDFFLAMQEFLASFNNTHTQYVDFQLFPFLRGNIGFNFKRIDGKWIVKYSKLDSLQVGDVINKVNDEPFDEYYERIKKYISASGERARLNNFCSQSYLFPIEFSISLEDGRTLLINQKDNLDKDIQPETSGKWLEEGKVAYIKIPNFRDPIMENKAIEFVEQFFDSPAIIVDLRENPGGSTPSKLTKKLMNKPYRWWLESTNQNYGIFNFTYENYSKMIQSVEDDVSKNYIQGCINSLKPFSRAQMLWHTDIRQPHDESYNGKLILLIDGQVISAAEDFAMPFKDNGRAILVGETTQGSTGQPYVFEFSDQKMVIVGAKRAHFPDGSPFEGKGIKPDIEIETTIEDIKAGKDTVLDYVMQNLVN
jgi:carboxyl-terminal processing protease